MGDLVTISIGPRRGLLRGTGAATWYERGCALEGTDASGAIAAYRRALAGLAGLAAHADAHNNLGRLLHDRGELAEAEGHYRIALCLDRGVALYWFNLGVVVEDQGRHAEAIAAYHEAIGSDLPDAHFNLARLYEVVGRKSGDDVAMYAAVRHLTRYRTLTRAATGRR